MNAKIGGIGIVAGIVICAAALAATATGETKAGGAPRVHELRFEERNDGSGRRFILDAVARHTESLRFTVRYDGEKASGGSRQKTSISGKPWRLVGGSGVVPLIRSSLEDRGRAKVRVRARGGGDVDSVRLTIVRSECSMDPPFYPLTCRVKR